MRKGRKSLAQTKAPIEDRIKGSKINKEGSASNEINAKSIVLSDEIIDGLKQKVRDFNEKNKDNKVSLSTLKAVFRRGAGAFSVSHRPNMTRNGWAYARVNKFLEKKAGEPVKKAYVQDDDLMEKGGLLASNGKPSNLTPEQYKLVRTPEFKAWFGDWENDPQNASKVLDENREPLVVYHNSNKEFYIFKTKGVIETLGGNVENEGVYFSPIKEMYNSKGKIQYDVFLNIKNPFYTTNQIENAIISTNQKNNIIKQGFDGTILKIKNNIIEFVVFEANQIKLADGRNTIFDTNNLDIRFEKGGFITNDNIEVKGLNNYTKTTKSGKFYNIFGKRSLNNDGYEMWWLSFTRKDGISKFGHARYRNENDEEKNISLNELPKSLIEIYNNPDIKFEKGGSTDFGKVVSASSRFRPMETINFDPPLVGLNGAKLISYTWSFQWDTSFSKKDGEAISKRVSDWTQADISAETGRNIVHKYTIEMPNGEIKSVSSDSVPITLGYIDRTQKSLFPNLSSAAKTLAKQKLQLAILQEKIKEKNDALMQIKSNGLPNVEIEKGGFRGYIYTMGDANCFGDEPNDKERFECAEDGYIKNRLKEMGINIYANYNTYDLKNRIERQERKIREILKSQSINYEKGGQLSIQDNGLMDSIYPEIKEAFRKNGLDLYSNYSFTDGSNKSFLPQICIYKNNDNVEKVGVFYYDNDSNSIGDVIVEILENGTIQVKIEFVDWQVLENLSIFAKGGQLEKTHENLKKEFLQQNFKSAKSIEEIAKEKNVELEYAQEQLRKGMKIESEHSNDPMIQEMIALQHLDEAIDYYEKLEYMEATMMENGGSIGQEIVCVNCGWEWNTKDSDEYDKYICHKCGFDNKLFYSKDIMEKGGQIDPDNKKTKDMITHKSGNAGGMLVGNRHSEGGIKAINKSTNQPLEMEGGEVVITRNAVSDDQKREFEGEMLTNREILSKINESGGGVSFEEGGEVDYDCECDDKMAKGGDLKSFDPKSVIGKMLVGKVTFAEIVDAKETGNDNVWVTYESFSGLVSEENFTKDELFKMSNGQSVRGDIIRAKKSKSKMDDGGELDWGADLGDGFSVGNDVYITDPNSRFYDETGYVIGKLGQSLVIRVGSDDMDAVVNKKYVQRLDAPEFAKGGNVNSAINEKELKDLVERLSKKQKLDNREEYALMKAKYMLDRRANSNKYDDGGELDSHSELKQFFAVQNAPIVLEEPMVEEVVIEEEVVETPTEIMIFKEDLGLNEDSPMLYVGSSIYAKNTNGTDEWVVKSFTQDGMNITHIPQHTFNLKHEDKFISFDELVKLFKNNSIEIKFVLNERELNLILMILKDKLQKTTSFKDGGVIFKDNDGGNDDEIMKSQFGNKKF